MLQVLRTFGLSLTLSERMPPHSRHHEYSKKIECRHTGGKKKKIPDFCWNQNSKIAVFLKL